MPALVAAIHVLNDPVTIARKSGTDKAGGGIGRSSGLELPRPDCHCLIVRRGGDLAAGREEVR
ncbi:hypothetical protein [Nitrobacter hamburgensis]|uniref:hypothetical protein n=1 Tax=Nitrobacter hamburgensis TaxID=912 RepID=UPI0002DC3161|nr:hypothetical protein [Nitrobacter hamburgensis]